MRSAANFASFPDGKTPKTVGPLPVMSIAGVNVRKQNKTCSIAGFNRILISCKSLRKYDGILSILWFPKNAESIVTSRVTFVKAIRLWPLYENFL